MSGAREAHERSPRAAVRARLPNVANAGVDRDLAVRVLVIVGLFAIAMFLIPELVGIYWVKILTAAAIYSVVALGLGLLYGRVGMVSLCQIALLARDVCTDFRGDGLRISPHFFTNDDDVDRCFDELAAVLR